MGNTICGAYLAGTLKLSEIIPVALDLLRTHNEPAYIQATMCGFSMVPSYALEDDSAEWWGSEDASWALECILDAINDGLPEGLYCGSSDTDPADFGIWEVIS